MVKHLLLVLLLCLAWYAQAQTTEVGAPRSWKQKTAVGTPQPIRLPAFDVQAQLQLDAINERNKVGRWRFGYEHHVNYSINNAGMWETLHNGDGIWRMAFRSKDALSMNVVFSEFNLPKGATVHIYNADHTTYLGAYTHLNNNAENMLGTSLLLGETLVVEYYEPAEVRGQGRLKIGKVVHGYKDVNLFAEKLYKSLNDAGKCNYDILCPLGNGWEDQINSVAVIVIGGSEACTGALVNNTANDGTPYLLTANHCLDGSYSTWVFRFNWESPTPICAQNAASSLPPQPYNEVNGATLKASSSGSDFGLLLLNSQPQGDVYFAGWDKSGTTPTEVTVIHHPSGDVKKISRESDPVTSTSWGNPTAQVWEISDWDMGTTEPGSSGSPLFDQNKRIVGQLYGGTAACSGLTNNGQADNFGRFAVSWVGGGTSATRLSNWLDPNNTGVATIDGYNPNTPAFATDAGARQVMGIEATYCNDSTVAPIVTIRNFGRDTLRQVTIRYGLAGGTMSSTSWTGALGTSRSTTVALPSVTGRTGSNTFVAYTINPNSLTDSNAVNDTTRYTFIVVAGGAGATFTFMPDCYASESSWNIVNATGAVMASGDSYTDESSPTPVVTDLCLPAGCYTLNFYDSYGDGLYGNNGWFCSTNGDFFIVNSLGDTLVNLDTLNSNFGDSIAYRFCVGDTTTATNIINNTISRVQLFPNPARDMATLVLQLAQINDVQITLYNAVGQQISSRTYSSVRDLQHTIALNELSSGLYLVQVSTNGVSRTYKLLKE